MKSDSRIGETDLAKAAELNGKEWVEVLRRLKKYALYLTKSSVLRGTGDEADDIVVGALQKWIAREFAWDEAHGQPTTENVVRYLKPAVYRYFLDRIRRASAKHELPLAPEAEFEIDEELRLAREHLEYLVENLRPFLADEPLGELYIDLQCESDKFLSDDQAALALGVETKDIKNMKKRLDRRVSDMKAALRAAN
jgi:hypothetical protein